MYANGAFESLYACAGCCHTFVSSSLWSAAWRKENRGNMRTLARGLPQLTAEPAGKDRRKRVRPTVADNGQVFQLLLEVFSTTTVFAFFRHRNAQATLLPRCLRTTAHLRHPNIAETRRSRRKTKRSRQQTDFGAVNWHVSVRTSGMNVNGDGLS